MTALTLPLALAKILFRRYGARRSHGVGTVRAVRIHKTYGADAIPIVREDRYLLARDIRGVGFTEAALALAGPRSFGSILSILKAKGVEPQTTCSVELPSRVSETSCLACLRRQSAMV